MKTRNLFLSLFAFAAICACNKEAQPEGPQMLDGDAYVSVNIVTSNGATKALDDGFSVGEENNVSSALFIFFGEDGTFSQTATATPTFTATSTENPHVEKVSEATVVLRGDKITPRKMLVVLNPASGLADAVSGKTLAEVRADMKDVYSATLPTDNFVMTNSVYKNDEVEYCEAIITDENIKTSDADAQLNPVSVFVERVLAKVNVTEKEEGVEIKGDKTVVDGITIVPVIDAYALTSTSNTSYLYKNITGISWSKWNWSDPTNKRSYWATIPTETSFNKVAYNSIITPAETPMYCMENTSSSNPTQLIVAAHLENEATNEAIEIVNYQGEYYTTTGYLTIAAERLSNNGCYYMEGDTKTEYSIEHLEVVKYTALNAKAWEVVVALKSTAPTFAGETDPATVLSGMDAAWMWKEGKSYFYTTIEHFGVDNTAEAKVLNGIVRNHVYEITINSIKGLGTPVFDPSAEITPSKPEGAEYSLAAKINILKWKVVSQGVDLE